MNDGEFWLPAQFLTEEDLLRDIKRTTETRSYCCFGGGESVDGVHSPYGFSSLGPNSGLSSPVESVAGSTETESDDDDDYLAILTRKMAHSTLNLQSDVWKSEYGFHCDKPKAWELSVSPQSTLCSVLGVCGCKNGCSSKVPSPLSLNRREATLHTPYAAESEVAMMRMLEGGTGCRQNSTQFGPSQKPTHVSVHLNGSNSSDFGFRSDKYISYQQLQAANFQKLKQQQMMKQLQQNAAAWGHTKRGVLCHQQKQSNQVVTNRGRYGSCTKPLGGLRMPSAPANNLQQSGSGMQAVFLGKHGTNKRECAGTGVFLPRRVGTNTEPSEKPERVFKALNLETIDTRSQLQPRHEKNITPDYYAAALKNPSNFLMTQQRRNAVRLQPVVKNEVRLPQEWTY